MRKKIGSGRSRGTIRKRGNLQWLARIRLDGQDYAKTFEIRGDAERWIDALLEAGQKDDRIERTLEAHDLTLAQAMRRRLEIKRTLKTDQEPHTEFLIRRFPALCAKLIYTIDELDISAFIDRRTAEGVAPGTVNKSLSLISNTFNLARTKMDCVGLRNPIGPTTRLPEPPGIVRRLAADEEQALLAAGAAYEALNDVPINSVMRFASETAMRLGEIGGMDWRNVDLVAGTVYLQDTKNGTSRSVPLGLTTRTVLRERSPKKSGLVWGKREAIKTAWKRVRAAAIAAAEARGDTDLAARLATFRFHDFRHEGTSRLIERTGWENARIKAVTGHKTDSMLQRYTHLRSADLARELARMEGENEPCSELRPGGNRDEVDLPEGVKAKARWRAVSQSADLLRLLVQDRSLRSIGRTFGVSDVAVHKACARMGISKKPKGFWLSKEGSLT